MCNVLALLGERQRDESSHPSLLPPEGAFFARDIAKEADTTAFKNVAYSRQGDGQLEF